MCKSESGALRIELLKDKIRFLKMGMMLKDAQL